MSPNNTMILFVAALAAAVVPANAADDFINVTVLGSAFEGNSHYRTFYEAARMPMYHSTFPFVGFNFSSSWDGREQTNTPNTNSSENWGLQFNYSTLAVNDPNQPEVTTVTNYVYSLDFPEESLPLNGTTIWQLCTHIGENPLPVSAAAQNAPNDGSCIPYFGEACYNAMLENFRTSARSTIGCPDILGIFSVPECKNAFGSDGVSIGSTALMNFTDPELYYNRSTGEYMNAFTNQTVSDPPRHGLLRNQAFASQEIAFGNVTWNLTAKGANQAYFSALSLVLSDEALSNISNNAGGYTTPDNNVRLFCGRPAMSYVNAASSLHGGVIAAISASLVVALVNLF